MNHKAFVKEALEKKSWKSASEDSPPPSEPFITLRASPELLRTNGNTTTPVKESSISRFIAVNSVAPSPQNVHNSSSVLESPGNTTKINNNSNTSADVIAKDPEKQTPNQGSSVDGAASTVDEAIGGSAIVGLNSKDASLPLHNGETAKSTKIVDTSSQNAILTEEDALQAGLTTQDIEGAKNLLAMYYTGGSSVQAPSISANFQPHLRPKQAQIPSTAGQAIMTNPTTFSPDTFSTIPIQTQVTSSLTTTSPETIVENAASTTQTSDATRIPQQCRNGSKKTSNFPGAAAACTELSVKKGQKPHITKNASKGTSSSSAVTTPSTNSLKRKLPEYSELSSSCKKFSSLANNVATRKPKTSPTATLSPSKGTSTISFTPIHASTKKHKRPLSTKPSSTIVPTSPAAPTTSAQQKQHKDSKYDTFTAGMLTGDPRTDNQAVLAVLKDPSLPMEEMCHVLCSRYITVKEVTAIQLVLSRMEKTCSITDAILYLEHYNWDVGTACVEYEADRLDRAGPFVDELGKSPNLRQFNPNLDRLPAIRQTPTETENFDNSKLKITITIDAAGNTETYTFPHISLQQYDASNAHHINTLNTWRRKVFCEHVGPADEKLRSRPPGAVSGSNGSHGATNPDWHPLETTYLASRYGLVDCDHPSTPLTLTKSLAPRTKGPDPKRRPGPDYKSLARHMADLFSERWLPGRVEHRAPERGHQLVSGYISRYWLSDRALGVNTGLMGALRKHELAQGKIKGSRNERWRRGVGEQMKGEVEVEWWEDFWPVKGGRSVLCTEEDIERDWWGRREGGLERALEDDEDTETMRIRRR